jgi:hypothetical protein
MLRAAFDGFADVIARQYFTASGWDVTGSR